MSRSRLEPLARLITRDVFRELKARKRNFKKKLPGRKMLYIWDEQIGRDPFNDTDAPGFIVRLKVDIEDCVEPSIDAEAGEDDSDVTIWINITHDTTNKRHLETLYHELRGVVRHELEHLSEAGPLTMVGPYQPEVFGEALPTSGKILHSINRRLKIFGKPEATRSDWAEQELRRSDAAKSGRFLEYVTCFDELGPFVAGFMTQARSSRTNFDDIAHKYLQSFVERGSMSAEDRDEAMTWLVTWVKDKYPGVRLRRN